MNDELKPVQRGWMLKDVLKLVFAFVVIFLVGFEVGVFSHPLVSSNVVMYPGNYSLNMNVQICQGNVSESYNVSRQVISHG